MQFARLTWLFLLIFLTAGCLSQDVADYRLEEDGATLLVVTQIDSFEELLNVYSESKIRGELCFKRPDGSEPCSNLCTLDKSEGTMSCTARWPLWFLPNNNDFRLSLLKDDQTVSYSPYMTIAQLQDQQEAANVLSGFGILEDDDGENDECGDGEELNEDGECESMEDPADPGEGDGGEEGGGDDPPAGEGGPPDEVGNLCEGVACGPDQYCENTTGGCRDLEFHLPPEGTGGTSSSSSDQNNNDNNNQPLTGAACAFNPSQCADTKGWCQLNPSAPFNPFILIVLFGLPLALWFRRTV